MFYALSKSLDVLLSPLTWAILLALAGTRLRGSTGSVLSPLAAALVLYVFSIDRVSNTLMRQLETATASTQQHGVVYDAVVLLGGAVALERNAVVLDDAVMDEVVKGFAGEGVHGGSRAEK